MSHHGTLVCVGVGLPPEVRPGRAAPAAEAPGGEGVGVLLLGDSGIGKSECALELVRRGHRLVADDVVEIRPNEKGEPLGCPSARLGHHVEIRGLGILSVPDLFGADAVLPGARVDLACRLRRYEAGAEGYDRVGIERPAFELEGGARVPSVTLPAHPTGSLATLVEVAARDHALRAAGINAAERFDARLRREMQGAR